MRAVSAFYLWPYPYCCVARSLLELLRAEARAPGAALRGALAAELPLLDPRAASLAPSQLAAPRRSGAPICALVPVP